MQIVTNLVIKGMFLAETFPSI